MLKNYSRSINKEIVIFIFICAFSLFFRTKIIHELPLGVSTTEYGLAGFDDEPAHINYTKYISSHKTLPVARYAITDEDAFVKNEFEYHQPPLYYISISILSQAFNITTYQEQLLLGRYINLLISVLSIIVAYLTFLKLGWLQKQALIGCSFILLLGSHVYHTSLFSNDALSWLFIWTIFYLLLTDRIKHWLKITLLFILGHYTKSNILILYPILLWSFIYSYFKKDTYALRNSMLILIIPLLASFPWYYRNYQLYDSILNLSGSQWHFISGYFESFQRIIRAPYSFLFKMYFVPTKPLISLFNILQYITIFPLIAAGIWKTAKNVKTNYNTQAIFIMFFAMVCAYLWLALPTGFTEGRMLFPALVVINYFLFQYIFIWEEKFKLAGYIIIILVSFFMIPQYIIGFYL